MIRPKCKVPSSEHYIMIISKHGQENFLPRAKMITSDSVKASRARKEWVQALKSSNYIQGYVNFFFQSNLLPLYSLHSQGDEGHLMPLPYKKGSGNNNFWPFEYQIVYNLESHSSSNPKSLKHLLLFQYFLHLLGMCYFKLFDYTII